MNSLLAQGLFEPPYFFGWLILLLLVLSIIIYNVFFRVQLETVKPNRSASSGSRTSTKTFGTSSKKSRTFTREALQGTRDDADLGLVFDEKPSNADDLTQIKGVGEVLAKKLNDFGIYKFEQIAQWDEGTIREFSERLAFKDRVRREDWVGTSPSIGSGPLKRVNVACGRSELSRLARSFTRPASNWEKFTDSLDQSILM